MMAAVALAAVAGPPGRGDGREDPDGLCLLRVRVCLPGLHL